MRPKSSKKQRTSDRPTDQPTDFDSCLIFPLLLILLGLFRALFILDDTRFLKVSLEPLYSLVFIFVWGYFLESMASLLWTTLPLLYCANYDQYQVRRREKEAEEEEEDEEEERIC